MMEGLSSDFIQASRQYDRIRDFGSAWQIASTGPSGIQAEKVAYEGGWEAKPTKRAITIAGNKIPIADRKVASILAAVLIG